MKADASGAWIAPDYSKAPHEPGLKLDGFLPWTAGGIELATSFYDPDFILGKDRPFSIHVTFKDGTYLPQETAAYEASLNGIIGIAKTNPGECDSTDKKCETEYNVESDEECGSSQRYRIFRSGDQASEGDATIPMEITSEIIDTVCV